jgi:hypothetical protein
MSDPSTTPHELGKLPLWLLAIHWIIIINLAIQVGYGAFMVFVVTAPDGVSGPLWGAAKTMPFEQMITRRAYATETWIAIGALSLYIGLTEILPRRLRGSRP